MLENIHDKFFKKVFSNIENVRDFLYTSLPLDIQSSIALDNITIDPTSYISNEMKDNFCDIVVKTKLKGTGMPVPYVDIYMVMEHKSYYDKAIFVQLLKYMLLMWEKDIAEKKPLRIIIPLVFYHGKRKWDIPLQFIKQFKISDEIKKYLLNFEYILFDTNTENFENDPILKDNVFLLTALILMRSAFKKDWESVIKIFEFWKEKGFFPNTEELMGFLIYITATKDIKPEILIKYLEANKEGGQIMATLAQRWVQEGKEEGLKEGLKEGIEKGIEKGKEEGLKKGNLENAKKMLLKGFLISDIVDITGLKESEINNLKNKKNK